MKIFKIAGAIMALALILLVAGCSKENKAPQSGSDTTGTGTAGEAGSKPEEKHEIMVFAAASLRESLQDLGAAFEKANGVKVVFNFAGSNELAQQIVAAPKADIFLSAAENWMDTVEQKGKLAAGTRKDLLSNTLVVIAQKGSAFKMAEPCAMGKLAFKNLSLGDPKAVPAGKYAQKWLSSVMCGKDTLWNVVKDKVAPAPDVRSALGLVTSTSDVVGIVYRSDWLAFKDKVDVLYEVKDGPPIRYVVAQVAGGPAGADAAKFLQFIESAEARGTFETHGFTAITN